MADYSSNVYNVYFTTNFRPAPKIQFSTTFAYNKSDARILAVNMPDISARVAADPVFPGELEYFNFEHMTEYSDLDYEYIQVGLGMAYRFGPKMQLTADADFARLNDSKGYVFGIESGSLFFIRTGIQYDF